MLASAAMVLSACGGQGLPSASGPGATQPRGTVAPIPGATANASPASATPLPAGVLAAIPLPGGPISLAATADAIWVEGHRAGYLRRIDPVGNAWVEGGSNAQVHCHIAAGAGFVWTTKAAQNLVTKVDPVNGQNIGTIELQDACGIAVNDHDVWVASPGLGAAVRFDPKTLKQRASIALGHDVFWISIGPEAVWAAGEADGGTLYRIDPKANKLVATIRLDSPSPAGLAVAFGSVWVGDRVKGLVHRIDLDTNEVVATISIPTIVGGVGVGPDAIWASGFGNGTVYRIDPATNATSGSISTGQTELGDPLFAFDSIWVGALEEDLVMRLDPTKVH